MTRLSAIILTMVLTMSAAFAQGQLPGTLPPAYIPPPPPPVVSAPPPVPSAVTPLPSQTYGVPRGVTAPVYSGGGGGVIYRQPARKRHRFRPRRRHS